MWSWTRCGISMDLIENVLVHSYTWLVFGLLLHITGNVDCAKMRIEDRYGDCDYNDTNEKIPCKIEGTPLSVKKSCDKHHFKISTQLVRFFKTRLSIREYYTHTWQKHKLTFIRQRCLSYTKLVIHAMAIGKNAYYSYVSVLIQQKRILYRCSRHRFVLEMLLLFFFSTVCLFHWWYSVSLLKIVVSSHWLQVSHTSTDLIQ